VGKIIGMSMLIPILIKNILLYNITYCNSYSSSSYNCNLFWFS